MIRCPRCGGSAFPDEHREVHCLQCGWVDAPKDVLERVSGNHGPHRDRRKRSGATVHQSSVHLWSSPQRIE